jgi:hypothetical protein
LTDLFDVLSTFNKHAVEFVVIGAFSAVAQGYPLPTEDLDITPARTPENLERLVAALEELKAVLRLPGDQSMAFPLEAKFLGDSDSWALVTTGGSVDILFLPSGTGGYDDLRREAVEVTLRGTPVLLSSLRDVIRMKEASNREKDRAQLPALRRTLEAHRNRES